MIKKFKNGNIVLKLDENWHENFYHDEMFMSDLYFNQINGYMYLVDYNTQRMYDFTNCYINILEFLKNWLESEGGKIKLLPLPKRISKQLFIDLENEY